jgi:hypothetical protein
LGGPIALVMRLISGKGSTLIVLDLFQELLLLVLDIKLSAVAIVLLLNRRHLGHE